MVKQLLFEAVKTRQETEPEEVVVQEATETEEEKIQSQSEKDPYWFQCTFERVLG